MHLAAFCNVKFERQVQQRKNKKEKHASPSPLGWAPTSQSKSIFPGEHVKHLLKWHQQMPEIEKVSEAFLYAVRIGGGNSRTAGSQTLEPVRPNLGTKASQSWDQGAPLLSTTSSDMLKPIPHGFPVLGSDASQTLEPMLPNPANTYSHSWELAAVPNIGTLPYLENGEYKLLCPLLFKVQRRGLAKMLQGVGCTSPPYSGQQPVQCLARLAQDICQHLSPTSPLQSGQPLAQHPTAQSCQTSPPHKLVRHLWEIAPPRSQSMGFATVLPNQPAHQPLPGFRPRCEQ